MDYEKASGALEKIWSEFIDLERECRSLPKYDEIEMLCDNIMECFCRLNNKLDELDKEMKKNATNRNEWATPTVNDIL